MGTNPTLAGLEPLVGRWRIEVHGAAFLPTPESRIPAAIEIEWIEDGAAVAMRQGDSEHPPAALWIIGRDESQEDYVALYTDDRGVARVYGMSLEGAEWRMWRRTPEFSQRFEAHIEPGSQRIRGRWEKSLDEGASWKHDFNIDYTRDGPPRSET